MSLLHCEAARFQEARLPKPMLIVTPSDALQDEPVHIVARHLPPGQPVTIRACMEDDLSRTWASWATFQANEQGVIDVDTMAPSEGTYQRVDGTGLLWSMQLVDATSEARPFALRTLEPIRMEVQLMGSQTLLGSLSILRRKISPHMRFLSVAEQGIRGTLCIPNGKGPYPGIIVLGGSGGGMLDWYAALLASHEIVALALPYFHFPDLPEQLYCIPLEYFQTALLWLGQQSVVRPGALGVVGISRGGELALLLGTTYPLIRAVAAFAPSSVIWGGYIEDPFKLLPNPRDWLKPIAFPAWTLHGQPVPYLRPNLYRSIRAFVRERRKKSLLIGDLERLRDQHAVERVMIPVERIQGPVLLFSGADDQLMPAQLYAEMAMERLRQHPFAHEHVCYPNAGHDLLGGYFPQPNPMIHWYQANIDVPLGGTVEGNAHARVDALARTVRFLHEHLG